MKLTTLILATLLFIAGCKKELLTPCGNDIDTYTFPHQTIRTDSSFIVSNDGDRVLHWNILVYQRGSITYASNMDTVEGSTTDEILLSSMENYNHKLFSDTVIYDSLSLRYYPYYKSCTSNDWVWGYYKLFRETYLP